jgi:hydroxymethylbilane synthase
VTSIADLPDGSVIGTASLRRQAQIYAVNPTLKCVNFRGNVQTRLRKLKGGDVDATLLAYAGLKRMDMTQHATSVLEWEEMLPAIAQGAISFQCRSDDERVLNYLKPLSCEKTFQSVTCERAFLAALDGNCKTPIAGQARVEEDGTLHFKGLVSSPDGQKIYRIERSGSASDAAKIGNDAGMEVRKEAGEKFFEEMQEYVQEVQAANSKPTKQAA